jgi:ankyrin repeat protein
MLAVQNQHQNVVDLLVLCCPLLLALEDDQGHSALDFAKKTQNEALVHTIAERMKRNPSLMSEKTKPRPGTSGAMPPPGPA